MASPLDALKGLPASLNQSAAQATGDAAAIGAKSRMVDEYVKSTKPAPVAKPSMKEDRPMRVNPKGKYGDRPGEQRIDTSNMTKPLGSFKKGGKVKKTGVYKLHKGEQVANPKQTAKMDKMGGMAKMLSGDTDKDGQ